MARKGHDEHNRSVHAVGAGASRAVVHDERMGFKGNEMCPGVPGRPCERDEGKAVRKLGMGKGGSNGKQGRPVEVADTPVWLCDACGQAMKGLLLTPEQRARDKARRAKAKAARHG